MFRDKNNVSVGWEYFIFQKKREVGKVKSEKSFTSKRARANEKWETWNVKRGVLMNRDDI